SGYFSGTSLAYYTKGIANLINNRGKFRLIISHEISEKDYQDIIDGYTRRENLVRNVIDRINYSSLDTEQKVNLSNLGYLIEIGLVDIKIGFTHSGLFHAKYGLFRDNSGNIVYFSGSLNETEAAFKRNYEEITVLESWKYNSSEIREKQYNFEKLWNNESNDGRIFIKEINEI
ncbi:TPA: phospholipase D-like domain-containing protein, partial [Streptococcus suis]